MSEAQEHDLRLFVELLREFTEDVCEFTDKPDLLVTMPDAQVGVEHTRLYCEDPSTSTGRQIRPQERLQFQVVQRAFELYHEQLSLPLYLTVQFAEPFNYRSRDIAAVGASLAKSVLEALNFNPVAQPGQHILLESWDFRQRGLAFPVGVSSFQYSIQHDRRTELWGPSYAYMVPHLSVAGVEAVIKKKERLLEGYRVRCKRTWLLIATDVGMPSSHHDVPSEVTDTSYITQFERVFLMTIAHRNLAELHTVRDLPSGGPG